MMKKIIPLISAILLLAACNDKEKVPRIYPVEKSKMNTVVVYLGTDNNFGSEAWRRVNDLVNNWDYNFDGNLLVYADAGTRQFSGYPENVGPTLMWIHSDKYREPVIDTLKIFSQENSADWNVLNRVLKTAEKDFPATTTGLAVLSHATGWLPEGGFNAATRSIISDGNDEMEIADFAKAIPSKLDYIIFDACFMAGIEVFYELKDKAKYIVSSPAEVLADPGFLWTNMMSRLMKKNYDLEGVAQDFYDYNSKRNPSSATVSIFNTDNIEEVAYRYSTLLYRVDIKSEIDITSVQKFVPNKKLYYDLGDMMDKLREASTISDNEYQEFMRLLNTCLEFKIHTPTYYSNHPYGSYPINAYSGVTIYIEQGNTKLNPAYEELEWYKFVNSLDTYPQKSTQNTVVAYIATDNNVGSEAWRIVNDLRNSWDDTYDGNLLVYADAGERQYTGHPENVGPTLMWIHSDKYREPVIDTLKTFAQENSADWNVLNRVLKTAETDFPATTKGLAVFGHGTGWLPLGGIHNTRAIFTDGENEMEIADFAKAITSKLDYIIFDAPFMAGIEVFYELKDKAKYIISSSTDIVSAFNWEKMMGHLMKNEYDLESVAQDFYDSNTSSCTVSVFNNSNVEELSRVYSELLKSVDIGSEIDSDFVQRFIPNKNLYFDLGDMMLKLREANTLTASQYKEFTEALNQCVELKLHTPTYITSYATGTHPIDAFSGVTVYIDEGNTIINQAYEQLEWYKRVNQ